MFSHAVGEIVSKSSIPVAKSSERVMTGRIKDDPAVH